MKQAKTQILENNKNQLNQSPPKITEDSNQKQSWKIIVPLQYSKSEYSRLISWIIARIHD